MSGPAGAGPAAAWGEVYRIDWQPGTDLLHGTCHCGAEHTSEDPVEMWTWMLGHPVGQASEHPYD